MCGRYALSATAELLGSLFRADVRLDWRARYNIAPTQDAPVVVALPDGGAASDRQLAAMRWGLIPSWAKDPSIGSKLINARSETAAEKPAFRSALRRRRCVVPASGFYEWQSPNPQAPGRTAGGGRPRKQPYFIRSADAGLLAMAGLWESWADRQTGELIHSFVILTTEANDTLRPLHHRMPVILDNAAIGRWLDPTADSADALLTFLRPAAADRFVYHPVSTRVNSPVHDDPSLIEPAG